MDSVETICEECGGKRFKREALEYKYKNKSIPQVLAMTIEEAAEFFTQKEIINKLKHIVDVGLHYMTLGQPLDTLSGGECQRLKFAKELSKKGNIYIMDESFLKGHQLTLRTAKNPLLQGTCKWKYEIALRNLDKFRQKGHK